MKMKKKILELLKGTEGYVSGQDICKQLGVSRTAVWKNVKALKEEGYEIDSVNNRGYKLLSEPDVLGREQIERYLQTRWLAREIHYEAKMDSTNTQAKRLGEHDAKNGMLIVTECQTAGKGRRGRSWESPAGNNVYFTLLLRPEIYANHASMITLLAALVLTQAISDVTGLNTQIKWPNDVIANGKKLCGILTESSTDLEYLNYVVVGIGVNVNQLEFPEELQDKASSIRLETGKLVNRAQLLAAFLNRFEECYECFLKTEDLSAFWQTYNERLVNRGKEVKVIEKNEEHIRKALGIDAQGGLVVENADGKKEVIISGEVSVRGLYGYV